jgi:RNA polymerase sigma-70 factor, ECF subfamily
MNVQSLPYRRPEPSADEAFLRLVDQHRAELVAYCYRMLGSVHDAEDLVQETLVRAWRGLPRFEGRSSVRTWLYTITTRACLTALERRRRSPLPVGLGAPGEDILSSRVVATDPDPASVVASREAIRRAFSAALRHLPPRQRMVLILREVLGWPAREVASTLGTTPAAVNSLLQRARTQVLHSPPVEAQLRDPPEPAERALLDRYVWALEERDPDALVALLIADVA